MNIAELRSAAISAQWHSSVFVCSPDIVVELIDRLADRTKDVNSLQAQVDAMRSLQPRTVRELLAGRRYRRQEHRLMDDDLNTIRTRKMLSIMFGQFAPIESEIELFLTSGAMGRDLSLVQDYSGDPLGLPSLRLR